MPAGLECPATPPLLPRDPTPERVKLSPSGAGGRSPGSPGRASPDSACPICLGRLENKAFSDGCMHKFCFTCIVEWSKVRAVCPLCKQAFTSIIHNVRSEMDYDRYRLPPPPPPDPQEPFIYRPGATERARWLQLRRQQAGRFRSLVLPMLWPVPAGHDYHLPAAPGRLRPAAARNRVTSESRRRLYQTDRWARPTADQLTGRYRETGPDFYRSNPACTHRLVPWLNRELNAVLDSPAHLAHVMEHIMELITRIHIRSPEFRAHLQPYMSPWTEHFVHELYCYARSPYDMVGYDLHVQYEAGRPASPEPEDVLGDEDGRAARVAEVHVETSSGSDSDVRVISPAPPRRPELTSHTPEPDTPESPEPGPSGVSSVVGDGVGETLRRVRDFLRSCVADSDDSSDSDEVEVVDVVPPRHLRPHVVVTLSSDEEPPPPPPAPAPATVTAPAADRDRRRRTRGERREAKTARSERRRSEERRERRDKSGKDRRKRDKRHKSKSKKDRHRSEAAKSKDKRKEAKKKRDRGERTSKSRDRTEERASKSSESAKSSKSSSSKHSLKSTSSEYDIASISRSSNKSYSKSSSKSCSSSKYSRYKSSESSSTKSVEMTSERSSTSRSSHCSKRRRHHSGDDPRSRDHKRSRLSASPSDLSPAPSTSRAPPRRPSRTGSPSSSRSSSESVRGVPVRGARTRRLSSSEEEGSSDESVCGRRPAVRSAVVAARRPPFGDSSDSSDW